MEKDFYNTLAAPGRCEIKIKGSRFIGQAFPAAERDQAEEQLAMVRKEYYDATHNCFAYRIGLGGQAQYRYSDDGEPAGTAGKPILQALDGSGLTNALVVVTRYFGGTKLGTGGLTRAYAQAAGLANTDAGIIKKYLLQCIQLRFSYEWHGLAAKQIEKFAGHIESSEYGQLVQLQVTLRSSQAASFMEQIIELSGGKINVSPCENHS